MVSSAVFYRHATIDWERKTVVKSKTSRNHPSSLRDCLYPDATDVIFKIPSKSSIDQVHHIHDATVATCVFASKHSTNSAFLQ